MCKALRRKVADDTLSDIFFLNLGSWLGFNRTKVSVSTKKKKDDVIGALEVLDLLFFVDMDTLVRLKQSHEPRF